MVSRKVLAIMASRSKLMAIERLIACYDTGGKLLICGNGGSAADCEHIVGELMKAFVCLGHYHLPIKTIWPQPVAKMRFS